MGAASRARDLTFSSCVRLVLFLFCIPGLAVPIDFDIDPNATCMT